MSGSIQMPKYKCHKEVWALKIEQVKADNAGRAYLHFADERYAPIEIANGWLMKHMPVPGGYYVQYQDGYTSYSPAEAFESGYALIEKLEVPDPSKNEMSVAFRLAAQIAGIKDEVADFMAGLDGALMAGKSVEDLCDELQERIALYDTPEAVDLFMQWVKPEKLNGKYISANATVIDAYQLPLRKDVIANEFVEWAREHGVKWSTESPDALQVYRGYGDLLMDAFPGEWVAKCNKGAVHVFEPEVFATLYTSAAELLK